jgi:nitrogen regulatory protein PII
MSCSSQAQILQKAKGLLGGDAAFTKEEAANALKQALEQGTVKGVSVVSQVDGYLKNPEIKIPFPPEAENVEQKLRAIGLGNQVDEAVESLNRAAEDAASEAKDIFITAIKALTIQDAINIVKGEQDAATRFLERTTTAELTAKFSPIINSSLQKVNATKYWGDVMGTYNKIPFVKKVETDLTAYVTQKAIDGLFVMIANEELNIRQNPAARTTELLKKVFK